MAACRSTAKRAAIDEAETAEVVEIPDDDEDAGAPTLLKEQVFNTSTVLGVTREGKIGVRYLCGAPESGLLVGETSDLRELYASNPDLVRLMLVDALLRDVQPAFAKKADDLQNACAGDILVWACLLVARGTAHQVAPPDGLTQEQVLIHKLFLNSKKGRGQKLYAF